ncbi:MAG: PDZ domain-containing protein [Gemmataceae bacterium]|nr:PDZ domain-containing protein [Gemmataceae bacterium]
MRTSLCIALLALAPDWAVAQEVGKPHPVPYRLTDTQHVLVRMKVNGKGPYNFVVDTGCPVLIIATPIAEKIGLKTANGWATIDDLQIEGGLSQKKVKARIETPFQIEGMNKMGLPGVELHGLLGYTVIAKYKMEFDFTRDRMQWTPLAFEPAAPQGLAMKGGGGAGMDMMVGLVKMLTFIAGLKPAPPPVPRGFMGLEFEQKEKQVAIKTILAGSPAAEAGLESGDRVTSIDGKAVGDLAELQRATRSLPIGAEVKIEVRRGEEKIEAKVKLGQGA